MNTLDYYAMKLSSETDAWDLREAMAGDNPPVVLDVRRRQAFEQCHIDGAMSFPHAGMTAEGVSDWDRNKQYVVYCDGLGCNAATNAAFKLCRLGLSVRELIGGLEWWRQHGYGVVSEQPLETSAAPSCACD